MAGRVIVAVALVAGLGFLAAGFNNSAPVRPESEPLPRSDAVVTPVPAVEPPVPTPAGQRRAPGIRLVVTPRSNGTFDVVETVTLRNTARRLVLAPPSTARVGRPSAAFRPRADTVQVHAGGQPVPMRPAEVRARRMVLLPSPADRIELHYRLTGAIIRSVPSKPGRALGLVAPLTAGLDGSLPVSLTVDRARNLLCPLLHSDQRLCAGEYRHGMTSRPGLTARDATIVVQLDLPRAA